MLELYKKFELYIGNASWLFLERVISLLASFLITALIARYLGPHDFGLLAYAISLMSVFAIAGHMGLSGLVVRELVRNKSNQNSILGTVFVLKLFAYLVSFLLLLFFALYSEGVHSVGFYILIFVASSVVFKPFEVLDFWFNSRVEAKYVSLSKVIALFIVSIYRISLVLLGSGVVYFALSNVIGAVVLSICLCVYYVRRSGISLTQWEFKKTIAKDLVSQGWMVFLGSIFAVIYLKIDQVMLGWMQGMEDVGTYAVAATLSEAWYFFPGIIVATFFPKLISLRDSDRRVYNQRLQDLFDFLFLASVVVAILVSIFSSYIVTVFFGDKYEESAVVLSIHIWASVFVFMRSLFSKWVLIEGFLVFSIVSQGLGALMNVALNYILIPYYASYGAALATLFSYAVASYFSLLFHPKTRNMFYMMSKSMFFPFRIFIRMKKWYI